MSSYSVAEAKNTLPRLLDRALDGEQVIITRHGKPIAEIRSLPAQTLEQRRAFHAEIAARRDARPPLKGTILQLLKDAYDGPSE